MDKIFRCLALICLIPLLSSCAGNPSGQSRWDLTSTPVRYHDSEVYRAEVQVMVHPTGNLDYKPTALFAPLGMTQDMGGQLAVSQGVSRIIWQRILGKRPFSVLEMADMRPPYRVDMALPYARQLGADLLVGGYITYYKDGGQTGLSSASIQLEVYKVSTGELYWSMAHAAQIDNSPYRDYVFFESHDRMPADPMGAVLNAIGDDFGTLLNMWTSPGEYEEQPKGRGGFGSSAFGRF